VRLEEGPSEGAPDGGADPASAARATLRLFDGSEEPLDPSALSVTPEGEVYARVKGGAFEARFSRHAQAELGPLLVSAEPPRPSVSRGLAFARPRAARPPEAPSQ
jgi:hypothetical protein